MPDLSDTVDVDSFSWKLLLRRIKKEKTVLLIGPEVIIASQKRDISLKQALQEYIQKDLEGIVEKEALKKIQYYSEDGFFYLEDEYKSEVLDSVLQFYEEQELTDLYRKLVQIPFHLILSLSPDKLLEKAMKDQGLTSHFHYYSKQFYNKEADDRKLNFQPSLDNRLIYNIFGSVEEEESLILSYDDLFEFLQRVFNNYHLPETVREALQDANYFVFIGFNYGKWYLKLLLRLMNMHEKVRKVFGMDQPSRQELETFFVNEFDMKFTQKGTLEFVDELYQKCQAEEMLMVPPPAGAGVPGKIAPEIYNEAKGLITKDRLKDAFDLLQAKVEKQPEFHNTMNLIQARLNSLIRDDRSGVLGHEKYTLGLNKIRKDLLELLNDYR